MPLSNSMPSDVDPARHTYHVWLDRELELTHSLCGEVHAADVELEHIRDMEGWPEQLEDWLNNIVTCNECARLAFDELGLPEPEDPVWEGVP